MENVKGLLSAKVGKKGTLGRILADLEEPSRAFATRETKARNRQVRYHLFSLVTKRRDINGRCAPEDFVVHTERYGIPQARHRIVILGVRSDLSQKPNLLQMSDAPSVGDAIDDLPRVRSGLSKENDSPTLWHAAIHEMIRANWFDNGELNDGERKTLKSASRRIGATLDRGREFVAGESAPRRHRTWFRDKRLHGFCNHTTRGHIRSDLHRYFFASVFAREKKDSPLLEDFPPSLLPAHKNVKEALKKGKFNDRFRVQLRDQPSTTVVSHIAKDGHTTFTMTRLSAAA